MRNSKPVDFLSLLVIAGSLLALGYTFHSIPPEGETALAKEVGKALAREAAKLLGGGQQVTLIVRDTSAFEQPAMDAATEAFKEEIAKGGTRELAVHQVQLDLIKPTEVPAGDFFELLRRGNAQQVIVSMMGPPLLSAEQRQKLGVIKPKVAAFCGGDSGMLDLQGLFSAGLLHCAIVERRGGAVVRTENRTFEKVYQVLYGGSLALTQRK